MCCQEPPCHSHPNEGAGRIAASRGFRRRRAVCTLNCTGLETQRLQRRNHRGNNPSKAFGGMRYLSSSVDLERMEPKGHGSVSKSISEELFDMDGLKIKHKLTLAIVISNHRVRKG